jgi:heme exporter protein A
VLEGDNLECVRGGKLVFRGLSFALAGGELLRIAGPNGSGKSSLLRIACGLLSPSQGTVRWKGESIGALREEYSTQLVYLGHAAAVKDDLSAAENLSIACRIAGIGASRAALDEALARFGLQAGSLVRRLSQGQRRRVALTRLLLSEAQPLWILDEPFTALDAGAARLIEELIAAHVARGGAAIYATHDEGRIPGAAVRVIDLGMAAA